MDSCCRKKTSTRKKSKPEEVNVVVYNIDYAEDEEEILLDKRNEFKSKYGKYIVGQSGNYGWCDTYQVSSNDVSKFRREYKKYWISQQIPVLRVDANLDMSNLGKYLDHQNKFTSIY